MILKFRKVVFLINGESIETTDLIGRSTDMITILGLKDELGTYNLEIPIHRIAKIKTYLEKA